MSRKDRKRDWRIEYCSDYIQSPKHGNSLKAFLAEHPTGAADSAICRLLDLNIHELREIFNRALANLKDTFGVNDGNKKV